jgi:uncharacterized membrane protein YphA (DoxX/SURF4 family)
LGLVRIRKQHHDVVSRGEWIMTSSVNVQENKGVVASEGRGLHKGLWAAQVLLAVAFFAAGMMKSTTPVAELQAKMAWIKDGMEPLVRFIGITEVLGALGLILPSATRIKPILTPLAAVGLAITMVLAMITHLRLGEYPGIVVNVVLGGLAAFVAWGRFGKAKIAAR